MPGTLNQTPQANRLHIGIFGRRNAGKSSLINALTGQRIALASEVPGTTTDPVYKAMEIQPIGPCVFIDTAGFDDEGELGGLRVQRTREAAERTDVAVLVFCTEDVEPEREWVELFRGRKTPVVAVVNQADLRDPEPVRRAVREAFGLEALPVSAATGAGVSGIVEAIVCLLPEDYGAQSIVGHLVEPGDTVLLVMPQDIQAPKGRLILPQVQTIRDLLDHGCVPVCVTTDRLEEALAALAQPPKLIITDSQVFATVYRRKPQESALTSFSVLFAGYKGDLKAYLSGAEAIDRLTEGSRVLIAEACTHKPLDGDIGRVKLPNLLRKRVGPGLRVEVVSGTDYPRDLGDYDLIIHCGGCMFNRRYVLSRIQRAQEQGVPITNYGVAIAKLAGILDKVVY